MNLLTKHQHQTCQAALSAPGACRQATPNRVTTAVADACAATAHGRHATNVRSQGRNASGMARFSSGLKALTLTAMSIRLQAGGYPTTLILPPLPRPRDIIISRVKHPLARLVQQAQQAAQEAEELKRHQQQPTPRNDESVSSSDGNMPWPSPAALTDPLFQDLDRTSRFYLAHFSESVCKDLVVRDTPESNPFRELIPLTRKHPLLFQVLIATSAIHWSNVFRRVTKIPTGIPNPGDYLSVLRSKDLVTHQALIDALTA
ncbi:unnamed protein product, partial [Fusarium langsethiae]